MAVFEKSIDISLDHEGGYVNHPNDPGGETKFGITKKRYPDLDIKNLSLEQAKKIYKRDFWDKNRLGEFFDQDTATHFFDMVVNHNPKDAGKMLQRALNDIGQNVIIDGVIGAKSIMASNSVDSDKLANAMVKRRIDFYKMLVARNPKLSVFLAGWLKRASSFSKNFDSQIMFLAIIGGLIYTVYKYMKER